MRNYFISQALFIDQSFTGSGYFSDILIILSVFIMFIITSLQHFSKININKYLYLIKQSWGFFHKNNEMSNDIFIGMFNFDKFEAFDLVFIYVIVMVHW